MNTVTPTVCGTRGDTLGPGALATRRALLDAVESLLRTTPWHQLRVVDVARRAETSPASFYRYFETLADAVLHLAHVLESAGTRPHKHLRLVAMLLRFERTQAGRR